MCWLPLAELRALLLLARCKDVPLQTSTLNVSLLTQDASTLVQRCGVEYAEAVFLLEAAGGDLRKAAQLKSSFVTWSGSRAQQGGTLTAGATTFPAAASCCAFRRAHTRTPDDVAVDMCGLRSQRRWPRWPMRARRMTDQRRRRWLASRRAGRRCANLLPWLTTGTCSSRTMPRATPRCAPGSVAPHSHRGALPTR